MRTKLTVALIACFTLVAAQEKYSVVLERTKHLSPYEAIYQLMDYQQDVPQQPNVYYQLGNWSYSLLPSRNALYHYREYSELLYRTRLFYGNCLHFAKDQKLPGWQYEEIAQGEKRIEYASLEAYLRPRLEEVARRKIACDSIHNSFYRLVEQYNRCRLSFSSFLTLYTREKTAHLHLTAEQQVELESLAKESSLLAPLIESYRSALALEPLEGYDPQFSWLPIELYRLDGLTETDFLQNEIALWDYAGWVNRFLQAQTHTYEQLYTDVENEYNRLTLVANAYRVGRPISDRVDETLMGRCRRLEYASPRVQAVGSLQSFVRIAAAEQQLAEIEKLNSLQEIVPLLQRVRSAITERQAVTEPSLEATADSAVASLQAHMIRLAQALSLMQTPVHTSPVTGEVTRYTPLAGERVHALLPTSRGWRTAVVEEATQRVQVLDLNPTMDESHVLLQVEGEQPLLLVNRPDNRWALLTNSKIYWSDL